MTQPIDPISFVRAVHFIHYSILILFTSLQILKLLVLILNAPIQVKWTNFSKTCKVPQHKEKKKNLPFVSIFETLFVSLISQSDLAPSTSSSRLMPLLGHTSGSC